MRRIPFGVASSSFLLAPTLRIYFKSLKSMYPGTVALIKDSFYIDDLIAGAFLAHDALRFYKESTVILADTSMELRKWASDSSALEQLSLEDGSAYDTETGMTRRMKFWGLFGTTQLTKSF